MCRHQQSARNRARESDGLLGPSTCAESTKAAGWPLPGTQEQKVGEESDIGELQDVYVKGRSNSPIPGPRRETRNSQKQ